MMMWMPRARQGIEIYGEVATRVSPLANADNFLDGRITIGEI